jgi:hypothetical protein
LSIGPAVQDIPERMIASTQDPNVIIYRIIRKSHVENAPVYWPDGSHLVVYNSFSLELIAHMDEYKDSYAHMLKSLFPSFGA